MYYTLIYYVYRYNIINIMFLTDVDECSLNYCDQTCRNTIGSFVCECDIGFQFGSDLMTCSGTYICTCISVFDKLIWCTIGPKSFLFGTAQFSFWARLCS